MNGFDDSKTSEDRQYTLVLRSRWGARPPKATRPMEEPVQYIMVHWTDTDHCTTLEECCKVIKRLQEFHIVQKGYDDIGYNFLVAEDGNVYEGRGWGVIPLAKPNFDEIHGKCLSIGQVGRKGAQPTIKLVELVNSFLTYGSDTGHLTKHTGLYPVFD